MSRSIRMQGLCRGTAGRPGHGCAMKRLSIIIVARNEADQHRGLRALGPFCRRSHRAGFAAAPTARAELARAEGAHGGGDRLARLRPAEQPRHRPRRRRLVLFAGRRRAHHARELARRDPRRDRARRCRTAIASPARPCIAAASCGTAAGARTTRGGWPGAAARRFTDAFPARAPCRSRAAPARCGNRIVHYSFRSMESVLEKLNRYSTAERPRHDGQPASRLARAARSATGCGRSFAPTSCGWVSWTAAGASCWRCPTPRAPITATSSCG